MRSKISFVRLQFSVFPRTGLFLRNYSVVCNNGWHHWQSREKWVLFKTAKGCKKPHFNMTCLPKP